MNSEDVLIKRIKNITQSECTIVTNRIKRKESMITAFKNHTIKYEST